MPSTHQGDFIVFFSLWCNTDLVVVVFLWCQCFGAFKLNMGIGFPNMEKTKEKQLGNMTTKYKLAEED